MDILNIKGDLKSPFVNFNPNGTLKLWGRSLPENPLGTYTPLYKWLDEYKNNPAKKTIVDVQLEYFNTSSSKLIFETFKKFEEINNNGGDIIIKWYYESDDPDLMEEGELYAKLINVDIELIPIESFDFSY